MSYDLTHLDEVIPPDKYERDEPPPTPLGDLPPWRTTIPVLTIVLAVLVLAGVAAEVLHRGVGPR